MRNRILLSLITLAAMGVGVTLTALPAAAQYVVPGYENIKPLGPDRRVVNRTAIPRLPNGKPNFTGVWAGPGFSHRVGPGDTDTPTVQHFDEKNFAPYKPGGEALFLEKNTGDPLHDDPTAYCLPDGFPREALAPYSTEIIMTPDLAIFRYEYMHFSRVVPLDGRPHTKDLDLTFMGESIGHWEGDTLVIDTIGIRKWTLDASTQGATRYTSDDLHVIERITYTDPMTAKYTFTIDDPKIWQRPWSQDFGMKLHPTWKIYEQVCEENNRCEAGKCRQ
jgi:hypothetical protein